MNILTALAENENVVKKESDGERRQSPLRGSSILWATSTSLYTRRSYSLLSIPKAIEAGMKSVSG